MDLRDGDNVGNEKEEVVELEELVKDKEVGGASGEGDRAGGGEEELKEKTKKQQTPLKSKKRNPVVWSKGAIVGRKYRVVREAGHGAHSTCYLAAYYTLNTPSRARKTGRAPNYVAIKVLHQSCGPKELKGLDSEAQILRSLPQHNRIVHLLRCFSEPPMLVLQWCGGGSLFEHYRDVGSAFLPQANTEGLTGRRARRWLRQTLSALQHLHFNGIMHRDVKAGNVLLSSDLNDIKLADFGLACPCSPGEEGATSGLTKVCGTPNYIAPEVLRKNYGYRADLWSFGILCHYVFVGYCPFSRVSRDPGSSFVFTPPPKKGCRGKRKRENQNQEKQKQFVGWAGLKQAEKQNKAREELEPKKKKKEKKKSTIYMRIMKRKYDMSPMLEGTAAGNLVRTLLVRKGARPDAGKCMSHAYFTSN